MHYSLETSVEKLKTDILTLAHEVNADKTFKEKLSLIKHNNMNDLIYLLVQFIAALNGAICNSQKAEKIKSLKALMLQLSELKHVIYADTSLHLDEKQKLSHFINANIVSMNNVLEKTF